MRSSTFIKKKEEVFYQEKSLISSKIKETKVTAYQTGFLSNYAKLSDGRFIAIMKEEDQCLIKNSLNLQ